MFINVKFLNNFKKKLTYKVPEELKNIIKIGTIIKVPLKNSITLATIDSFEIKNNFKFKIKSIDSLCLLPADINYFNFIKKLSNIYQLDSNFFLQKIQHFLKKEQHENNNLNNINKNIEQTFYTKKCNAEQEIILTKISNELLKNKFSSLLLKGVTGSGKTIIYEKLISATLKKNKSVIFMLPEVSLALELENILKNNIKDFLIIGFHSSSKLSEKNILWNNLLKNTPICIIGVHLPVLLPISNLGLIIIDEEHESGYQEKQNPKINSKYAATIKAFTYKIPILFGSATPSISILYSCEMQKTKYFELKNRYNNYYPKIEIVSLKEKNKVNFWITKQVYNAIKSNLEKKEQTLIFLNRRGYSFFIQCQCSFVFYCKNCAISLTLHNENNLICHYCNYTIQLPQSCPDCKLSQFIKKGIGTQQLIEILNKLFPSASIKRIDSDSKNNKKIWAKVIADFHENKIDILVGTQSIIKGYDFKNCTLVCVIWADLNLHFPIYNAAELTLQQLIQVIGRSGRHKENSKVIIQSFENHKIYNFLDEKNYIKFYKEELSNRIEYLYPPYFYSFELEITNKNENTINSEASEIKNILENTAKLNNYKIIIQGPTFDFIAKIKNCFIKKIYCKSKNQYELIKLCSQLKSKTFTSKIFFNFQI